MNETTFEGQRVDEALACLADGTRREILMTLKAVDHDETLDAAQFRGGRPEDDLSLHHIHLPKLAEADLVRWHRERDAIERGELFHYVEPLLDVVDDHGWS